MFESLSELQCYNVQFKVQVEQVSKMPARNVRAFENIKTQTENKDQIPGKNFKYRLLGSYLYFQIVFSVLKIDSYDYKDAKI